jgi:hypothetical protein
MSDFFDGYFADLSSAYPSASHSSFQLSESKSAAS